MWIVFVKWYDYDNDDYDFFVRCHALCCLIIWCDNERERERE